MTTYEMTRCKRCAYLFENDDGRMVCRAEDEERDIHDISDEDCPVEQEW